MAHANAVSPEIYTPQYYARIATLESRHWWHLGMQSLALALLTSGGRKTFNRVLDAGCGTGGMMDWAERKLSSRDIRGVDIAPEALTHCRARNQRWQLAEASVLDLPFPDSSFDLVISNDVLQHLPIDGGDSRGVHEMARVLAPGGALLLRTNSRLGMWHKADARDADYQRFLREEVLAMMNEAGLIAGRATYANLLGGVHDSLGRLFRGRKRPAHAEHSAGGRTVYEGLQIRDTAARHPVLNRILRAVLETEARYLARAGRSLPFGHSIVIVAQKPEV